MQAKITQSLVQNIEPQDKVFRVNDTIMKGFSLIVRPSGKKTWIVDFRKPDGSRTDYKIGTANVFTVAEAREEARKFLNAVERGIDPTAPSDILTFGAFVNGMYEEWVSDHRKSAQSTLYILKSNFEFLFNTPLNEITIAQVEQWRSQRKKQGLKSSSLNRRITALKAAINWAVKRSIIENHPLAKLERLSERDSDTKVRYLTDEERERLMATLDTREDEMKLARDSHNDWLKTRKFESKQTLKSKEFADHLKPIVLLSLSTGIRQNSMFSLEWGDINFTERNIMVRAATSKNEKGYYVPLNDLAFETISLWKEQSKHTSPGSLVFPSPQTGKKMDNCNTAWRHLLKRADIQNFRWHDMRHDFASQLVMEGVDLNTVRELMGHADMKMTLRYAHLAPENKLQAVKALDRKRRANANLPNTEAPGL
jgi:site-specific recombinase XerD